MDYASQMGHIDIIKFLHENRTEGCTEASFVWALQHNHIVVLEFLYENYRYIVDKLSSGIRKKILNVIDHTNHI